MAKKLPAKKTVKKAAKQTKSKASNVSKSKTVKPKKQITAKSSTKKVLSKNNTKQTKPTSKQKLIKKDEKKTKAPIKSAKNKSTKKIAGKKIIKPKKQLSTKVAPKKALKPTKPLKSKKETIKDVPKKEKLTKKELLKQAKATPKTKEKETFKKIDMFLGDVDLSDIEAEQDLPKKKKSLKQKDLEEIEEKIEDSIENLAEHFRWDEIRDAILSLDFFIDNKSDECIEKGCDNIKTTLNYCRLHYIKNWKILQRKKDILKTGKLQDYITELVSKYPPKFIDAIISDLHDPKEFNRVLGELNILTNFNEDDIDSFDDMDTDSDSDISIEARDYASIRSGLDED